MALISTLVQYLLLMKATPEWPGGTLTNLQILDLEWKCLQDLKQTLYAERFLELHVLDICAGK
jgi:hypothetical protein